MPLRSERCRVMIYDPLSDGYQIKVAIKERKLNEVIYPNMIRALQEGGFEGDVDWWTLWSIVAVGGELSLNGPLYPNPRSYQIDTIKDVFMRAERTLAHALMTAVFCKEVPLGCCPISFKEVHGHFQYDTHTGFRRATHYFQAENGSKKDLYRIIIEGTGDDLSMHRFAFHPSFTWLRNRFPETSVEITSIDEELGLDSILDSQIPPHAVILSAAATGGGGGDSGGRCPRLSAATEPLVSDLKSMSEFGLKSVDFYRCVVQTQTSLRADMQTAGSKSTQKRRASARLAAAARP